MSSDKQLVIIMEGPDGCGKTEIGKALSEILGIPYFKVNSEHENWRKGKFKEALEFDQTYISQFLQQTGHSCIIDRAYPSEKCYSSVFNRDTNSEVLAEVDDRFSSMGTIIVLCRRTWDGYSAVTDELVENVGQLRDLDAAYEDFREWTKCNVVEIFVDEHGDDLARQIPKLIEGIQRVNSWFGPVYRSTAMKVKV